MSRQFVPSATDTNRSVKVAVDAKINYSVEATILAKTSHTTSGDYACANARLNAFVNCRGILLSCDKREITSCLIDEFNKLSNFYYLFRIDYESLDRVDREMKIRLEILKSAITACQSNNFAFFI